MFSHNKKFKPTTDEDKSSVLPNIEVHTMFSKKLKRTVTHHLPGVDPGGAHYYILIGSLKSHPDFEAIAADQTPLLLDFLKDKDVDWSVCNELKVAAFRNAYQDSEDGFLHLVPVPHDCTDTFFTMIYNNPAYFEVNQRMAVITQAFRMLCGSLINRSIKDFFKDSSRSFQERLQGVFDFPFDKKISQEKVREKESLLLMLLTNKYNDYSELTRYLTKLYPNAKTQEAHLLILREVIIELHKLLISSNALPKKQILNSIENFAGYYSVHINQEYSVKTLFELIFGAEEMSDPGKLSKQLVSFILGVDSFNNIPYKHRSDMFTNEIDWVKETLSNTDKALLRELDFYTQDTLECCEIIPVLKGQGRLHRTVPLKARMKRLFNLIASIDASQYSSDKNKRDLLQFFLCHYKSSHVISLYYTLINDEPWINHFYDDVRKLLSTELTHYACSSREQIEQSSKIITYGLNLPPQDGLTNENAKLRRDLQIIFCSKLNESCQPSINESFIDDFVLLAKQYYKNAGIFSCKAGESLKGSFRKTLRLLLQYDSSFTEKLEESHYDLYATMCFHESLMFKFVGLETDKFRRMLTSYLKEAKDGVLASVNSTEINDRLSFLAEYLLRNAPIQNSRDLSDPNNKLLNDLADFGRDLPALEMQETEYPEENATYQLDHKICCHITAGVTAEGQTHCFKSKWEFWQQKNSNFTVAVGYSHIYVTEADISPTKNRILNTPDFTAYFMPGNTNGVGSSLLAKVQRMHLWELTYDGKTHYVMNLTCEDAASIDLSVDEHSFYHAAINKFSKADELGTKHIVLHCRSGIQRSRMMAATTCLGQQLLWEQSDARAQRINSHSELLKPLRKSSKNHIDFKYDYIITHFKAQDVFNNYKSFVDCVLPRLKRAISLSALGGKNKIDLCETFLQRYRGMTQYYSRIMSCLNNRLQALDTYQVIFKLLEPIAEQNPLIETLLISSANDLRDSGFPPEIQEYYAITYSKQYLSNTKSISCMKKELQRMIKDPRFEAITEELKSVLKDMPESPAKLIADRKIRAQERKFESVQDEISVLTKNLQPSIVTEFSY